jgi:hypothetical protein
MIAHGGWRFSGEKGWLLDPSQQERVRTLHIENMARIDEIQTGYPECALCGQRAIHLDTFGLCSKTSQSHREWRADAQPETPARFR